MKKTSWKRIVGCVTALAVSMANLSGVPQETGRAAAAEGVRAIAAGMGNVASPAGSAEGWLGDCVYYGDEDGQPFRWRVLDKGGNVGNSSVENGVLLQADSSVHSGGQEKKLKYSDVSDWLNNSGKDGFLSRFTAEEQQIIMSSEKRGARTSPTSLLRIVDLKGEKVFLPDAADLATASYGYQYDGTSNSMVSCSDFWWLRSEYKTDGKGVHGCVLPGGMIHYSFDDEAGAIVPAMNLQKDKILFTSAVSMDKASGLSEVPLLNNGEWKFTLLEEGMQMTAGNAAGRMYRASGQLRQAGEEDADDDSDDGDDGSEDGDDGSDDGNDGSGDDGSDDGDDGSGNDGDDYDINSGIVRDGSSVTVPYTVTDASRKANQLSLMISEGDYTEGNILYYGKVADLSGSGSSYFTFTLPEGFDRETHRAYLIPEQVNGGAQTDYAGTPVSFVVPPLHIHSWGAEWASDEDAHWHECIVPGCDLTADDVEEKDGYEEHDMEEVIEIEATCSQDGRYHEECSVCHYRTESEEEPMLDHERAEGDEGTVIKAATCTEEGELSFYCALCGAPATEEIDMLDHDFDDWVTVKEATFHEPGLERHVCVRCGEVEEDEIPAGEESHEHDYVEVVTKEATCEEKGVKTFTCKEVQCGDVYTENIKALGHQYGEWVQTVAPTETTEGQRQRTCSRCGSVQTEALPVAEHKHDFSESLWQITEEKHWLECACGEKKNYKDHEWDKGDITVKPTKTTEGAVTYHCKQCDYAVEGVIPAKQSVVDVDLYRYRFTGIKKGILCGELLGFAPGKKSKVVNIPDIVTVNGARLTVKSIRKGAFKRNKTIEKLILPDSLETIGKLAFFRTTNITQVTLGKNLKKINMHAFCHLKSLEKFTIQSRKLKVNEMDFFHGTGDFTLRVPAGQQEKYKKFFPGGKCKVVKI